MSSERALPLTEWRPLKGQLTLPLNTEEACAFEVRAGELDQASPEAIAVVYAVIMLSSQHVFHIVTTDPKRFQAQYDRVTKDGFLANAASVGLPAFDLGVSKCDMNTVESAAFPPKNLYLGLHVETQSEFDRLWPDFRALPAAKRLLHLSPLRGGLTISEVTDCPDCGGSASASNEPDPFWGDIPCPRCSYGEPGTVSTQLDGLDGVIVGGEHHLPEQGLHPDWVEALYEECELNGVPFRFLGWGAWVPLRSSESPHHDCASICLHGKLCDNDETLQQQICTHCDQDAWRLLTPGRHHVRQRVFHGRVWDEMPGRLEFISSDGVGSGPASSSEESVESVSHVIESYARRRIQAVEAQKESAEIAGLMFDQYVAGVTALANHCLGQGASRDLLSIGEDEMVRISPDYWRRVSARRDQARLIDIVFHEPD